jgi:xylan 1,4-beta-xylosidase
MRQQAETVRNQVGQRSLYFTEWNIASNPRHHLHDEPFAAAFATRILMDVQGLVNGYSYWTFSDIFEENYFPSIPFQGGFGLLTLRNVAKPIYRAFQLLHHLGNELLHVNGSHETVSVWGVRKEYAFTFLLVNQAMPEHSIHTEFIRLRLTNTSEPLAVYVERIDGDHANPKQAWLDMGQPEYLSASEADELKSVSQLVTEPLGWNYDQGTLQIELSLPPQSVAAVTLEMGVDGVANTKEPRQA